MGKSNIEWTEETWNPIVGCSIVSPGCTNCYAMRDAWRKHHIPNLPHYHGLTKKVNGNPVWTGLIRQAPEHILRAPLRRRAPTMWFVNSMSDLFHESIPDEWIDHVFAVMALCPHHTFQVLTKRADRMRQWFAHIDRADGVGLAMLSLVNRIPYGHRRVPWPLPNVWLGVSCERQQEADKRIPLLLQTPAAIRFISAEPLLAALNVTNWLETRSIWNHLDWVIIGGESGGSEARPFNVEWADQIIDQCRDAGVACFVKQLGSFPVSDGYPLELNARKGGDWNEWPDRLRVREMPQTAAPRSPVMNQPRDAEAIVP